jgi:hypothetical protein
MTQEAIDKAYHARVGSHLDQYLKLELMTYDEFLKRQAKEFADKPVVIVSKSNWWDALECLPPVRWHDRDGMNVFFMSEFYTGSYTTMYVKVEAPCGARSQTTYASKTVDIEDESTWITRAQATEAYVANLGILDE